MAGCNRKANTGGTAGSPSPRHYLVIFSQCNNAEPYRAAQNERMAKLWSEKPDVSFEITDAQQDNSKQIAQIETAILRKPDLLIVAPNERGPLTDVMGKAMDAGIKVICLERDILKPNFTTFIGSDNRKIGRLAGQFIVDHLTRKYGSAKGNLVHVRGLLGVEGEINRYGGAQEILAKHPDIKIVAEPVADWLQSRGRERMTEVLSVHPQIDVVYGHNDPMAIGAYLAAKEVMREQEMIFIGIDALGGPAGGIRQVMDGVLASSFVYPLCVQEAVQIGDRLLRDPNFVPAKTYEVASQIVTRENAADLYGTRGDDQ
jgi:ribose transport system substrate-binding protein